MCRRLVVFPDIHLYNEYPLCYTLLILLSNVIILMWFCQNFFLMWSKKFIGVAYQYVRSTFCSLLFVIIIIWKVTSVCDFFFKLMFVGYKMDELYLIVVRICRNINWNSIVSIFFNIWISVGYLVMIIKVPKQYWLYGDIDLFWNQLWHSLYISSYSIFWFFNTVPSFWISPTFFIIFRTLLKTIL